MGANNGGAGGASHAGSNPAFQDADMSGGNVGVQNSQGGAGESQDYCWQMIKVSISPK